MMGADVAALVREAPELEKGGCYVLRIRLSRGRKIQVGRLGTFFFWPGEYLYVGSARGGLAKRLARCFRGGEKLRWHIDYLLRFADIEGLWYCVRQRMGECEVSRLLQGEMEGWPRGFGSSDCSCGSHLYRLGAQPEHPRQRLEQAGGWHYLGRKDLEAGRLGFRREKEARR